MPGTTPAASAHHARDVRDRGARAPDASAGPRVADISRHLADRRLFARMHRGEPGVRDELVERFLPLARSLARRYERSGEPLDDLVQVASLGLVKAIDRFDPAQGTAFSSYAVPTIVGELKRHFRDRTWLVRPPRALQELALRVEHATARLFQELDRAPTVDELAAALGSTEEQILEALQARAGRGGVSLQAPRKRDGDHQSLQDAFGSPDDGYATAESREILDSLMTGLSPRLREILRLRFDEDLTQAEIAKLVGVSQMQVSRLTRRALRRMRESVR